MFESKRLEELARDLGTLKSDLYNENYGNIRRIILKLHELEEFQKDVLDFIGAQYIDCDCKPCCPKKKLVKK